jgi:hypothetical protein
MPNRFPLCSAAAALMLVAGAAATADPNPAERAWEEASLLLYTPAHRSFAALNRDHATAAPETRFGEAVTLLNVQPKTSANIERAAQLLTALRSEQPTEDLGLAAAYLLARIEQIHRLQPDRTRALALYDELAAAHPDHPYGQRALLKALLLRLYEVTEPEEKHRRLRAADALAAQLTEPHLRSEYHQLMATAGVRFGMPAEWRLPHLLAADELGIVRLADRRNNLLAIAEAARAVGQRELALTYYQRFIGEALRDEKRAYALRRYEAYRDGREVP